MDNDSSILSNGPNHQKYKDFWKSIIKIAVAIIIVICFFAIISGIIIGYLYSKEQEREKKRKEDRALLAIPKDWNSLKITALENSTFHLRTLWKDGHVYYQLYIDKYPKQFRQIREEKDLLDRMLNNFSRKITIIFKDKNGFTLFKEEILLKDISGVTDNNEKVKSLYNEGNFYLSDDVYKNIFYWEISWSL